MAQATHLTRDEEIQKIHKRYADFYKIGSGLILVLIGIWIGSLLFSDGYATNVYTEILSVIATIVVLDQINQWRDTQRLQKRLLREISGQSNIRAKDAIDWMGHEKWLTTKDNIHLLKETNLREAKLQGARLDYANLQNTNLQNAKLQGANLEGAYLQGANLREAKLQDTRLDNANLNGAEMRFANLEGARLIHCNLQDVWLHYANLKDAWLNVANMQGVKLGKVDLRGAELWRTNLQNADIGYSNLQGAKLGKANLQGANLSKANLRGADLLQANLQNARLTYVEYDEKTILPDAEMICSDDGRPLVDEQDNFVFDKYWTPETDMSRYTDPNHPDFWQPDWVEEEN